PGAQRLQYIRWLQRRGGAGGPTGDGYIVDSHEQRLAFHVGEADVEVARQAVLHRAVYVDLVQPAHDAVFQAVAKSSQMSAFLGHFFTGDFTRLAKADNSGNVQRAGTHAAFVAAAIDDSGDLHARVLPTNVEGADVLGGINLVRRDRHQVDVVLVDVDGDLPDRLHTVGVEENPTLATDLADLTDGLQNANLVVRSHDRDQDRLVIDR